MSIKKELAGLNNRIQKLRFKENPPSLRMKVLQPWEVEEESDLKDEYCLMARIEERNPNFNT